MAVNTQNKPEVELADRLPQPRSEQQPLLTADPKAVNTFAQQLSEQLRPMDESLAGCSPTYLAEVYWSCAWQALKLLPNTASILFTSVLMYSLLTYTKQPEAAAAFGMYGSFYFVFCTTVQASLMEKFGQEISRGVGKKDYQYVRKMATQGMMAMLIFFLAFNIPTLWFSDRILTTIGIDTHLVPTVAHVLRLQIFVLLVQLPADMLNAFCMAQGLESEISRVGIFGCLVSSATQAVLVLGLHTGIEAFVYGSLAAAICSLANALLVLPKCHPETRGFADPMTASVGLTTYLSDSLYFFLAIVGECSGANITAFFIAARHDTTALGAYTATRNCGAFVFRTGLSLASVSRTRINILIGMGKHQTAKNFYTFYAFGNLCVAVAFAAVFLMTREYLAMVLAGQSEDNRVKFITTMSFYSCFCCLSEMSLAPCLLGLRTLGKAHYQILVCLAVIGVVHIPSSCLLNWWSVHAVWLVSILGANFFLISVLAFSVSRLSDWSKIKVNK